MNFGQLIEYNQALWYNTRNIFHEKSYTNGEERLFLDPFLKIKIQHISGSKVWKLYIETNV